MKKFEINGALLSHTMIDFDYIIRFDDGGKRRLVSSQTLKEELDKVGAKFFVQFVCRAYRDDDNVTCKLRRGIKVEFFKRY